VPFDIFKMAALRMRDQLRKNKISKICPKKFENKNQTILLDFSR